MNSPWITMLQCLCVVLAAARVQAAEGPASLLQDKNARWMEATLHVEDKGGEWLTDMDGHSQRLFNAPSIPRDRLGTWTLAGKRLWWFGSHCKTPRDFETHKQVVRGIEGLFGWNPPQIPYTFMGEGFYFLTVAPAHSPPPASQAPFGWIKGPFHRDAEGKRGITDAAGSRWRVVNTPLIQVDLRFDFFAPAGASWVAHPLPPPDTYAGLDKSNLWWFGAFCRSADEFAAHKALIEGLQEDLESYFEGTTPPSYEYEGPGFYLLTCTLDPLHPAPTASHHISRKKSGSKQPVNPLQLGLLIGLPWAWLLTRTGMGWCFP